MQVSKLNLSDEEAAAITDCSFFNIKLSVTKKIVDLFGQMEAELKNRFQEYGIEYEGLNYSAGKIFRGENYKSYPYIVLDYPRLFSSKSIFAFRTMFWWGHEFSFTLHLQGEALDKYALLVFDKLHTLKGKETYFCVNDTPWQYNFEKANYRLLDDDVTREEFSSRPFLKLSRKIKAARYDRAAEYGYETFELFFELLKSR